MVAVARAERSFADRLVGFLDQVECRLIEDEEDCEAVFRLRYEAYVREGAIPINGARRFTDYYDDADNTWILGIFLNGELASSIRIHVGTPETPDIPGMGVFSDLLLPELQQGHTIIDPVRFVADHRLSRLHPELPYATVRLAFVASEFFDADIALATVRAEHQAFYRRTFRFQPMCEPRDYPGLMKPISLMSIHFPTFKESVAARYPFLNSTADERAKLFTRGRNVLPFKVPPYRPAAAELRLAAG